jgi:ankyrin repeat protein
METRKIPLLLASEMGHDDLCQLLLRNGAAVDAPYRQKVISNVL